MPEPITFDLMQTDHLLWRCLHGGPLTPDSLDQCPSGGDSPWESFRSRNLPFLEKMTRTYGACAVVARIGNQTIGHLRFYPKAIRELAASGSHFCLQQHYPYGPADDIAQREFPPLEQLKDKTLVVQCMMIAPDQGDGASRQHQGIGTRLALRLIQWAAARGWTAIEATAYEDLDWIYQCTGQAGRTFWKKIGFRVIRLEKEPYFEQERPETQLLCEQAMARGLSTQSISNKYTMRRELA